MCSFPHRARQTLFTAELQEYYVCNGVIAKGSLSQGKAALLARMCKERVVKRVRAGFVGLGLRGSKAQGQTPSICSLHSMRGFWSIVRRCIDGSGLLGYEALGEADMPSLLFVTALMDQLLAATLELSGWAWRWQRSLGAVVKDL